MKLRHFLVTGIAAVTLVACSSKPAPDLYVLRVPETAPDSCTKPGALLIDRPAAPKEYDTKRIAVMVDAHHLNYYTGASWASAFPEQLQGFLSDALARQGMNVLDSTTADADHAHKLHLTIREADIKNLAAPVVHLRLTGSIESPSGRTTHFNINEAIPATENHMPQIIEAYDQAALNAAVKIGKAMKVRCAGVLAAD